MRRHPKFLERHPDLFGLLTVPHQRLGDGGTDVIDLQRAILDRLRKEITQLQEQRGELLATTRSNLLTQTRIHAAVLALLSAPSFEQLLETVSTDLAVLLDVDIVVICAEGARWENSKRRECVGFPRAWSTSFWARTQVSSCATT